MAEDTLSGPFSSHCADCHLSPRYTLIAVIVYYFFGQDVASPALSSASPLIRKIAWTISIPTILVAGVIAAMILNTDTLLLFWDKSQLQREVYKEDQDSIEADEKGLVENNASHGPAVVQEVVALPAVSSKKYWTFRTIISKLTLIYAERTCHTRI